MDNVLYFPHISIPQTPWLTRAILYWDSVASIIPSDSLYRPGGLTPIMQELVDAELIKPEHPSSHIYRIPRFSEAFLYLVDNHPTILKVRSQLEQQGSRGRYGHLSLPSVLIHMEKLDDIAFELQQRGLAVPSRDRHHRWGWFEVESVTGYYFMAYLASVIGAVAQYQPTTDKPRYLSVFLESEKSAPTLPYNREKWRAEILRSLLPGPARLDSVVKLASFKEKYDTQLKIFRNEIETFILDLESCPEEQRRERIERFLSVAQLQRDEIQARMKEHQWAILSFGTLLSIGASALPLVDSLPAGSMFEAFGAGLGVAGAVLAALNAQSLQEVKRKPMAYAVLEVVFN